MTPLYLKFLAYKNQPTTPIDFTAEKLLEIIATCHYHEPLTVTEAMELQEVAAPATIHRKICELEDSGYIHRAHQNGDMRTKYLLLTQKGIGYIHMLSTAMVNAVRERIQP